MASVIDGKAYALGLRGKIASSVSSIVDQHNVKPALAVVLVGEDPASQVYVRSKGKHRRRPRTLNGVVSTARPLGPGTIGSRCH